VPDLTAPGESGRGLTASGQEAPETRFAVIVGTDHHPFDRVIRWVNDWLGQHPEQAAAFFVQAGTATVPPVCESAPMLDVGRLATLLDESDVMICHGGPGSIADAWQRGHLPIVVPRMRRFGEHVDDHQVDFCRKFADLGRVRIAEDAATFTGLLDEARTDRTRFRATEPVAEIESAVARFDALVDELINGPRRKRRRASRSGL